MAMTPQRWSISALSVEFGLDRRTVAKRLKDVAPLGMDGRAKVYALADAAPCLIRPALPAVEDEDEYLDPVHQGARVKKHQADKLALEVKALRGSLIPEDVVRSSYTNFVASCRAKLLSMPSILATRVTGLGVREVEAEARDLIHGALDEMKDYDRGHFGRADHGEAAESVRQDVCPAAESDGERVGGQKPGSVKRGKCGTRKMAD